MTKVFDGNAALNSFVKDNLDLQTTDRVLEIGFGSGQLINAMADVTSSGLVEGIDFSQTMLKLATKVNKEHISSRRVILYEGDCSSLPFEDGVFDKLCSVNTLYFWGNPVDYLTEMFRVIKPGGKIAVGFRDAKQLSTLKLSDDVFNPYSQNDVIKLLSEAGFRDAHVREKEATPFTSYCAIAAKSERS